MSTSSRIASRLGRLCRPVASFVLWTLPLAAAADVAGAATLPAGFSETQLASGLASPTAMAIAPDGRIFVCEQSGRLRVIKNGALLPTPFLTVTVSSVGERGLLGVAFDPDFATNRFVYVYYTATAPADSQSHQPVHGQRRQSRSRDGRQRSADLQPSESQRRDQPQRRGHSLRARRHAVRGRGRERQRRERPIAEYHARQDPADQEGWNDSVRQPILHPDDREQPRHLGARRAQSLHVRVPAGDRPHAHQRRGPEHVGRSGPRDRRGELRLAERRRSAAPRGGRHHLSHSQLSKRRRELRDRRVGVLQPAGGELPGRLRRTLLLRRLLRRVHPDAQPA